ncbi:MAG TPA: isoleucine--tRNA ligase [Candidatus Aphodoplasma excrementigallinarum]|uniref:Isoleucine--tRNA ligase n=1 Tax=Candidatus Aphodoplasma excrementigallinarum TaxID=2840673 RepID=A0A9D1NJ37_9FIRM|nr:isoleucine--tRNA ligase [Candidatus Aphodoplasma excrementigallinarum]
MSEKEKNYNATIKLPSTGFPMRGNLPQREPELIKKWEDERIYYKMIDKNRGNQSYILHDGPPYANGDIHIGHSLDKILKDFVIKYKNMRGFFAPYVPGWDTHGLPIEQQAIKKLGINRHEVGPVKFRQACREFATKYVSNQKEQFKRLGVLGDWDHPYMTYTNDFVAKQIEIFGEMAEKGLIYKGLKPVYWCPKCETALAEAEIEYAEDKTKSIYVKFAVKDDKGKFAGLENVYFVIWTTTTWTLPGNVAICLNPDFDYAAIKVNNGETYIVAKELIDSVCAATGIESYEIVGEYLGRDLEYITCQHPFIDRESLVILGDHVTLDAGTGCVHTAPGHGVEDYIACLNYDVETVVPVDARGYLNELAGEFEGLYYADSNEKILDKLRETNSLLAAVEIIHQYPHCWRCDDPIIFRAAEQWFASVDKIKDAAVEAINQVKWIPAWGQDRITSMVRDRNDWCISRQRMWGVGIPIFYCKECGKELINRETIKRIANVVREQGSDAWYALDAKEILGDGFKCEACGCTEFTKEKDIMDVWFDSGSSHIAVCENHPDLTWPPDLYSEGQDQYRGWFQSSLLTSVATRGRAPYSEVLTHGFVVDGEGKKMSKSKGNSVSPMEIVKKYGAEILRLWVASSDFKSDIRISDDMLKQLSEGYRKIRNTARYILGNLSDFDPNTDMVEYKDMLELDRWALMRLNDVVKKSIAAYDAYEYYVLYHAVHNFCVVDMSSFYLDIIKDRLYTEEAGGLKRRSAQSAMYRILDTLARLLAPVLAYTTEEIWSYLPHLTSHDTESVLFNSMPEYDAQLVDDALAEKWDKVIAIRADVLKALEEARAEKVIGQSLAADITVYADEKTKGFLSEMKDELATIFIVSRVALADMADAPAGAVEGEIVKTLVAPAAGEKCERCWIYTDDIGSDAAHPTLCARCAGVVSKIEE